MDPAEVRRKLGSGMQKILRLQEVPPARRDEAKTDAFEDFRDGVKAARKDAMDLLEGFAEDDMQEALLFLHRRRLEKKMQKRQAQECLEILLGHPSWRSVSPIDTLINGGPTVCVNGKSHKQVGLWQEQKLAAGDGSMQVVAALLDKPEWRDVRRLLLTARDTLQGLRWAFPENKCGFDDATDGCRTLYKAMNKIRALCESPGSDPANCRVDRKSVEALLNSLNIPWASVLRFLLSMYGCGSRKSWHSRIIFISATLAHYCSAYEVATAGEVLPWQTARVCPAQVAASFAEAAIASPTESRAGSGEETPTEEAWCTSVGQSTVDTVEFVTEQEATDSAIDWKIPSTFEYGHLFLHNGTDEALIVQVEETAFEFRLPPFSGQLVDGRNVSVHIRISRPGIFGFAGFRSRLARAPLLHQRKYHISLCVDGKSCECVPV